MCVEPKSDFESVKWFVSNINEWNQLASDYSGRLVPKISVQIRDAASLKKSSRKLTLISQRIINRWLAIYIYTYIYTDMNKFGFNSMQIMKRALKWGRQVNI